MSLTTVSNLQFLIPFFPWRHTRAQAVSHTHTHTLLHRRLLGDAPLAKVVLLFRWHPSPWRQLIASPDGNCAVKATIAPSFSSAYSSDSHRRFSFCPPRPPHTHPPLLFCPHPYTFHVPITSFLFIKKTPKSEGRGTKKKTQKPDRSCVLHGAGIVSHASEHSDITMAFPLTSIQI